MKFPSQKIWAIFEPRSNTTRRNVFQTELVEALLGADAIVVAEVAKLEQVPVEQRLDPARLMQELRASGKPAEYLPTVDSIVDHVKKNSGGGEVVCVFSNGGFGGIHQKLLSALQFRR
jgi:UDP-N-acetylmuramate: L-alanyl-gamma-D-glutamyl-meso-diaminopimelate ligase